MSKKGPTATLVCKGCGDTLEVRVAAIKRNLSEPASYYLCQVCNRTFVHQRSDDEVVIHHYPSIGRFTAYTVRPCTEEDRASIARAKDILARGLEQIAREKQRN